MESQCTRPEDERAAPPWEGGHQGVVTVPPLTSERTIARI